MKKLFGLIMSGLLITLLSAGCSSTPKKTKVLKVIKYENQDETSPYLRLMQAEMKVRNIIITYPRNFRVYLAKNLSKKYKDVAGLCMFRSDRITIWLDETIWFRLDDIGREMLMFHELGHCALAIEHDRTTARNGQPKSLMYPNLFDPYWYARYREHYLNQMAYEWTMAYGGHPQLNLEDILKMKRKQRKTYIFRLTPKFKSKRYLQ